MTSWADAGLVALGGATTLLGGAIESARASRRERELREAADRDAARERELHLMVSLHEAVLDLWPDSLSLGHTVKRRDDRVVSYATRIGRVKGLALRVQEPELRSQIREWVFEVGRVVFREQPMTDEEVGRLGDAMVVINEALGERIRELEAMQT